jgi:hypothetical protein
MINRFKTVSVIALGALMLASLNIAAARADVRDFEFVNLNRSASIVAAWLAPASDPASSWKRITIYTPIAPRSTSPISINGGNSCRFDIKVLFNDHVEQTFSNVNLCVVERVVAN